MFRLTVAPNIYLKLFELSDAEAVYHMVERNRAQLREWLPWVDRTHSSADIREFIAGRVIPQFEADEGPQCGIWIDGRVAGSVGCHPIDWANRQCSFGYWLAAAHQGRGVVTLCCSALIDHLFMEKDLHRVEIRCGTANVKSCAIPQRLGFAHEGIAREAEWVNDRWLDLNMWSMLKQDWLATAGQRKLKSGA